ncbi:NLR family CARD domain-containing protein 3-like protein [Lates japonicus]|uniref:NLR family CARD domain-containing protein 3-like protein n=1 Tax=Lates japonicus TaxID=270547 RepID=A0AAD3NHG1_LATJO|nr:NLR family CARD domain-containing protein 3-like protein [Lates japonicus]
MMGGREGEIPHSKPVENMRARPKLRGASPCRLFVWTWTQLFVKNNSIQSLPNNVMKTLRNLAAIFKAATKWIITCAELICTRVDQESSEVPSGQSAQQHQTHLDSIFMLLEENIVTFVKNELKKMQKVLSPDYPECLESQREDRRCWVRMKSRGSREGF